MRATNESWKHLPPPAEREPLGFEAVFTHDEVERIMLGVVPEQMEDKWFIYFDDGWLRFHRSWTGAYVYALKLDSLSSEVRVVDSWVNRNPQQYAGRDTAYDRRLVRFLIDAFLLKKMGIVFPMPEGHAEAPKGVIQHSYIGRGYPESTP
jgi:hypothetical protein